jgi:transposase
MGWREIRAWDRKAFAREVERACTAYQQKKARVVCCYEAGRDGFSIHRWLTNEVKVENLVVDSASIKIDRRRLQEKNDRLDGRELVTMLARYDSGQEDVWRVVRVPEKEEEDIRRLPRERERLKKEQTAHQARLQSLLRLCGESCEVDAKFRKNVDEMELPAHLRREVERESERLTLVRRQLREVEQELRELVRAVKRPKEAKSSPAGKEKVSACAKAESRTAGTVHRLCSLAGIGATSAWVLASELFGWREFNNRRELASCVGLAPVRRKSDGIELRYGISKAGNKRVRRVLVELAWGWLRHQPTSVLAQWFQRRFGGGSKRLRKIGIVAVARRLLVMLWRFVKHGVVPDGARLKEA